MVSARTGGLASVVDSVSFPSAGYAFAGVQPAESVTPLATSADHQPLVPGTAAPGAGSPGTATAAAASPSFVVDFSSGVSGGYVLDWRDPTTRQVLVQVPMRTALPQFADATASAQVGKHVDTAA